MKIEVELEDVEKLRLENKNLQKELIEIKERYGDFEKNTNEAVKTLRVQLSELLLSFGIKDYSEVRPTLVPYRDSRYLKDVTPQLDIRLNITNKFKQVTVMIEYLPIPKEERI